MCVFAGQALSSAVRAIYITMASIALWKISFVKVQDADAMMQKIHDSLFFSRCNEPKTLAAEQGDIVLTVPAEGRSRQSITKSCVQTFRSYGAFSSYTVEEVHSQGVSSGMSWWAKLY